MALFEVHNLLKDYYINNIQIRAIDDMDFNIEESSINVFKGISGCGKSTLLRLLSGLDIPTRGKVFYQNIDLQAIKDKQKSSIRCNEFGFVFQSFLLIQEISVYENIILPTIFSKRALDKDFLHFIIQEFGLEEKMNQFPNMLSGGEQQKVAIARAMINKPNVVFADEPTGNLDIENTKVVESLLFKIKRELNQTLIIVTHNNDFFNNYGTHYYIRSGKIESINRAV